MVQRVQQPSVVPIDGGECATHPVPLGVGIVREVGMGVLQQGDHHEPEVDEQVGDYVRLGHPDPSHGLSGHVKSAHHHRQRYVTDDNF